jgi:acetylornithine deacetylase
MRLVTEVEPIKEIIATTVGDRAEIKYSSQHAPVRLMALDELPQCVVRFTTDIPYLTRWGKPLLLGPGSIFNAHTDHERISKTELSRAVELYVGLARLLSGRVASLSATST